MKISNTAITATYKTIYITPSGFDYDELEKSGYSKMTITVSYDVSYNRTWTSDFLYNGSQKYDIFIKNEDGMGVQETGLTTTSKTISRTITYTSELVNIKNNRIILEIGSINVQNDVIFKDINVYYRCYK